MASTGPNRRAPGAKPTSRAAARRGSRHGSDALRPAQVPYVQRPFAGRADEADLVSLREVVPSATSPLQLTEAGLALFGDRPVRISTVLPLAWAALVRPDGSTVVGLQTAQRSGDWGRDLGQVLEAAATSEPGLGLVAAELGLPEPGPRWGDLVVDAPLEVTVHEGFDWWLEGADAAAVTDEVRESMERASASVVPTVKVDASALALSAAYWCRIGAKEHLRWAMPMAEDDLLDALARLHLAGALGLGEGTKYVGAFRASGLAVPVWDLPEGHGADALAEPVVAFAERLTEALAVKTPLTGDERRARAGIIGRQITLR